MVTEYGMSKLGPVQYEQKSEGVFLGRDYANKTKNFSDQVALEIDEQTREIIETCYEKAKKILKENKDLIMLLSDALMEKETLTKEEIESLVNTGKLPEITNVTEEEKTVTELKALAKEKKIKGYTKMSKDELEKAIEETE